MKKNFISLGIRLAFLLSLSLYSACNLPISTQIPASPTTGPMITPSPYLRPTATEITPPVSSTDQPLATTTPIPILSKGEYTGPAGRVTIEIPEGGRYIVIGDSLSFGSTFLGKDTFNDICVNRWPYAEQLAKETGIRSTASLDRGESMKTPFLIQKKGLTTISYCQPGPDDPKADTAVPGSNTNDWLTSFLDYPVMVNALNKPENRVVIILVGADIFAAKIDKPAISPEEYYHNMGKIIFGLSEKGKIVYLAHIPYVRVGSFISAKELDATNLTIDAFNLQIDRLIQDNGYQDSEKKVDFGIQVLHQDGFELHVTTLQAGPKLDVLSNEKLKPYVSKDGLHLHAEGYNLIGSSWAQALKAPVRLK